MTVMCRLFRPRTYNETTKVISYHVFHRNKTHIFQSVSEVCSIPPEVSKQSINTTTSPKCHWPRYQSYHEMMQRRRAEALKSILVEIQSTKDSGALKKFCEKYGQIKKYFMYKVSGKNFVLVEFVQPQSTINVINQSYYRTDAQTIPVASPFFFFRNSEGLEEPSLADKTPAILFDETEMFSHLHSLYSGSETRLRDEMHDIHKYSRISDLSLRLRFFTCAQLEHALNGLFPNSKALPFGSSVCGFGRNTGDLDIFLDINKRLQIHKEKNSLFFHTKSWTRDKNLQLKVIGDLISIMLPGCSGVVSILSARVPIIKYRHTMSNVECDLNNSCATGVDLSHVLWIMNNWDGRVAPLVYTLRLWAAHNRVVGRNKPGPFITNFSLIVMVIFFLQVERVLPALNFFKTLENTNSTSCLSKLSDLTFPDLRTIPVDKWSVRSSNELGVDTLLLMFFKFYSTFKFETDKISLLRGETMPKSTPRCLEVENPIEPDLNITRNVSQEALQIFRKASKEAYIKLSSENYHSLSVSSILNRPEQAMDSSVETRVRQTKRR